jgi:hypothetical protein
MSDRMHQPGDIKFNALCGGLMARLREIEGSQGRSKFVAQRNRRWSRRRTEGNKRGRGKEMFLRASPVD